VDFKKSILSNTCVDKMERERVGRRRAGGEDKGCEDGRQEKMAPFETANFRQVRVNFVNSQTKVKKE
jgi:hypothetical protein